MNKWLSSAAILTILVISLFAGYLASNIGFDYDFERFFPLDDPETTFFMQHREQYGSDNDYMMIGLYNEKGIFHQSFLNEVARLTDSLEAIPSVLKVQSPTNLKSYFRDPLLKLLLNEPYLHYENPESYPDDSIRIYQSNDLVNTFFSEDRKSVLIFITHQELLDEDGCRRLTNKVESLLEIFPFDQTHLAGRCQGQTYYVDLMQSEVVIFLLASMVLIVSFLFIAFRSFWGIWLPLMVVGLSVVWLIGIMEATGKAIDIISNALPSIMLVVGLSSVIHIISKYLEELRKGTQKKSAIVRALKQVGIANLLTTITTTIGFLTLVTSSVAPINDFGIYAAIGVVVAFVLAYTFLPAVLFLLPAPDIAKKKETGSFWNSKLAVLFTWILKYRKGVAFGTGGLILLSLIGISQIDINNYILEDLRSSHPMKQDFEFLENKFSGARSFEMALSLKNKESAIWDREVLIQIDSIEKYLVHTYGVGFIQSPVALMKQINRIETGGDEDGYKLPSSEQQYNRIMRSIRKLKDRLAVNSLVDSTQTNARLRGMMGDWGSKNIAQRDRALCEFMQQGEIGELFDFRLTGVAVLIDKNNSLVAENVLQGLFIAFLAISLIVGMLFRSLPMVLICLIPNLLPLMIIGGLMGFGGIDLKMSTSIIFTIAFGIAVDDTIHFISRLRLELAAGRSLIYAIKRTFLSTGKAIVVTTLVLSGGFLTLGVSDFLGTFYIGTLISLTLLFAVISDLFLLPILLIYFYPDPHEKSTAYLP